MNKRKTLIICIIILLVAGAVTFFVFLTEPTAEREGASKQTAMLVEVTDVERGTFQPVIVATGNVQPSRDIILSPRVSGEVTYVAEAFVPGGLVKEGEVLLQIDPADFRNTLELRKGELSQAIADLQIEEGRQDVARQDYELVDEMLNTEGQDLSLVLREPQLNAAKAQVQAARAAVQQARLNLERATIRAPFDAQVLTRNVNVGSQISPEIDLGRLVGREEYWVVVTVPLSKLPWISIPNEEGQRGSEAQIIDRKAWRAGAFRTGEVVQLVGALENATRMARMLVSVPDPLAYKNDSLPRLIINSFVEVRIQGIPVNDVVRLNRDYLRENETVWVMEEDKLRIRDVDVVFQDAKYTYVSEGLNDGDQVVTTNLSTVADGASLRTEKDTTTQGSNQAVLRQTDEAELVNSGGR